MEPLSKIILSCKHYTFLLLLGLYTMKTLNTGFIKLWFPYSPSLYVVYFKCYSFKWCITVKLRKLWPPKTLRLITAMIGTCEQATKSLTTCNYHCCLWYSYACLAFFLEQNTIPEKVVYGFLSFSGVFLPWKVLNSIKLNQSRKNININNLYPCA